MPVYEVDVTLTVEADSPEDAATAVSGAVDNLIDGESITDGYVGEVGEV